MIRISRIIVIALFGFFAVMTAFVGVSMAEDKVLNAPIDSVSVKLDKNGAEYVRVIVKETRELSGISYPATTPVMFFGDMAQQGKALKVGDTLKAIVNGREYRGNVSYTAIKLL